MSCQIYFWPALVVQIFPILAGIYGWLTNNAMLYLSHVGIPAAGARGRLICAERA